MFLAAARFISCEDVGVADSTPAESQTEAISGAGPSGKGLRSSRSSALYPHLQRSQPRCALWEHPGPGPPLEEDVDRAAWDRRELLQQDQVPGVGRGGRRAFAQESDAGGARGAPRLLRPCPRMALVSWKPRKAAQASEN